MTTIVTSPYLIFFTPNYFRAKIDNDPADDPNLANTKDRFNVSDVKVTKNNNNLVQVEVTGTLEGNNSPNTISYQIYGNGEVVVTNTVTLILHLFLQLY